MTGLDLAEIFRQVGPGYRRDHAGTLSRAQLRVMSAIERCRTAALGGHVEQCDACGHQRIAFNSCRDRHCPKCQALTRAQWLDDRRAELLPVECFHVVFTVPQQIEAIAYQNKALLYDMLFKATAQTLRTIAVTAWTGGSVQRDIFCLPDAGGRRLDGHHLRAASARQKTLCSMQSSP